MNYENIELHNVAEIEPDVLGGVRLHRFPQTLLPHLSAGGRGVALHTPGCEIRFATEADVCRVVLTPLEDTSATVFYGPFIYSWPRMDAGKACQLHLTRPFDLDTYPETIAGKHPFDLGIWRIMLGWSSFVLHEVQTFGCPSARPCRTKNRSVRWLAHGSSITMGASATSQHLSYVQVAARLAGVDVLNKGMSGTCCLEPEMADFLAKEVDWDIATLELGINVRGTYSGEEFERRARYMVETMLKNNPGKPLALITTFTNRCDLLRKPDAMTEKDTVFRQILRDLAEEHGAQGVRLFEGEQLLDDPAGLILDLVHPSDYGMSRIGQNLSGLLQEMTTETSKDDHEK